MQKALVETSGSFELMDFNHNRQMADAFRPSVVALSLFFQSRVSIGQVRVLGTLTDEATDEEFEKYWAECETPELAVDSFLSAFSDAAPTRKSTDKGAKAAVEVPTPKLPDTNAAIAPSKDKAKAKS